MQRIESFATTAREYTAMHALPRMPLLPYLLGSGHHLTQGHQLLTPTAVQGAAPTQGGASASSAVVCASSSAGVSRPDPAMAGVRLLPITKSLDRALKEKFNTSQYGAILQSRKAEGITLIQGPPGTGKSSTILGTIGRICWSRFVCEWSSSETLSPFDFSFMICRSIN